MKEKTAKRVLLASAWWNERLIRSVADYGAEAHWHLDLQMCLTGQLPEKWSGDGIIALLGTERPDLQALLTQARCPVVGLDLNEPQVAIPRVAFDNKAVGHLAADHFLKRGFSSYAFYSRTWQRTGELRFAGFETLIRAAGFTSTSLVWELRKSSLKKDDWISRQRWLRRHLSKLAKPLAVFSADDTTAVEVIEACMAETMAIPDDVAILGTGDLAIFRNITTVPLSSVLVDLTALSHKACRMLHGLMDGDAAPTEPFLLQPGGIAARKSTDTIAARTEPVAKAIRFIFDHSSEPIGAPDIARAVGISKTGLYAAFKADLDRTPGAVLTHVRIDKAKRMLRETDEKVHTISEACGFGPAINLYRCFKRTLGISPQAYSRR